MRRAALACLLIGPKPCAAGESGSGLVVESVTPFSAAAFAGFHSGDLLVSWTLQARSPIEDGAKTGTLSTPFDLMDLFIERVPRGEVRVEGWRQGQATSWIYRSMGTLVLGLETRPAMELDRWGRFDRALRDLRLQGLGKPSAPPGLAEKSPTSPPRLASWYRLRLAEVEGSIGNNEAADGAFWEASEILHRASDPAAQAMVLRAWADQLTSRHDTAQARNLYQEALALERWCAGCELSVAYSLGVLAFLDDAEGDLAVSERGWLERLAILERVIPESSDVGKTLDFLGYLAIWQRDTTAAQERLNRAEAILRPISTNTVTYASTLSNLGILAQDLNDLERAEALQRQSLALFQHLAPGSPSHAGSLMNLSITLIMRGELASAEDALRQSADLFAQAGGDPRAAAGPQSNLGSLALYRGDLAAAQLHFERALSLLQSEPDAADLASSYSGLAEVARRQQHFEEAMAWEKRSLAIAERFGRGRLGRAERLDSMARIERESGGSLATAEALLRQADAIVLEVAPEISQGTSIRRELARVLAQRGRLREAETLCKGVLAALERRGLSGTKDEAEMRNLLGTIQWRRGELSAGVESLCRATRTVDLERSRLGGSLESRSWFESATQSYSFDCLSALIRRGRPVEAFHALERGKTRLFLQLLAERDLRFAELPPELKIERTRLDAEYDRVLSRLSELDPAGVDDVLSLRAHLEEIKSAREELLSRLRLQSPRLAALQAPAPLGLTDARRSLDHGTILVAYAVGPEWSYLFVVRPSDEGAHGLEVHRLPIARPVLEKEIEAYRRLLAEPQSDLAELNARASRLYDWLLRPAENRLAHAQRILISADGPLHLLPWAALRRQHRYLAQWRPISLTTSATVYAETRRARRPISDPTAWRLVMFGDPVYSRVAGANAEDLADSEVRSVLRRGLKLEPLPAAREEIEEIEALFPGAEVYLGAEATEEHAKQASSRANILHFASHGLLDERFPLDSALALTLPAQAQEGRENGLLQAWEIFESVRLDADLVTLSACDTALGKQMGGEGLLGLSRAFQFAGARSVLASLWSVADMSTAILMKRFYTYLRQGKAKDESLRAAQLELIRAKRDGLSHPYHWAAFSLYGDWR